MCVKDSSKSKTIINLENVSCDHESSSVVSPIKQEAVKSKINQKMMKESPRLQSRRYKDGKYEKNSSPESGVNNIMQDREQFMSQFYS